jgi:hypothetical protein
MDKNELKAIVEKIKKEGVTKEEKLQALRTLKLSIRNFTATLKKIKNK